MILKQASSSFNKASVTDFRPIRHFRKGKGRGSNRVGMWKTKTERKKGEKVAVAKAYSSTILDRKSPMGVPPCNLHIPWKNRIKTERGTLSLNPLHRTILEFTT